ncbi:hypothetical protein TNCV_1957331 [Trichonephila clavipes]|nr:hypothetical protein TNCV_1957331 [Trichonephila clavipes]
MMDGFVCAGRVNGILNPIVKVSDGLVDIVLFRDGWVAGDRLGEYGLEVMPVWEGEGTERWRREVIESNVKVHRDL